MFRNGKPKYGRGSLIIYNPTEKFGNEKDELFHINSVKFGLCEKSSKEEFLYDGRLFKIKTYDSKGISHIPSYSKQIVDVPENQLKGLEHLILRKKLSSY